jgi:RNA binding exosome subunit
MEIGKIKFRTYCHATEDPQKVLKALGFLIGDDIYEKNFEGKSKNYKISRTKGYFGNPIVTYEVKLTKSRDIRTFWDGLRSKAPFIITQLLDEIPERTDEDCYLHMRFDKQKAYQEKLEFTVHGDCIVVKVKIRAYPAKKELAVENIIQFLQSLQD